jgi:PAS domain S-box-containing protein
MMAKLKYTYFLTIILIAALLLGVGINFTKILTDQKEYAYDILLKQSRMSGRNIENDVQKFKEDLKYLISTGSFYEFLEKELPDENFIRTIRRFYFNNQNLVAEIIVHNKKKYRVFKKDENNYFDLSEILYSDTHLVMMDEETFDFRQGEKNYIIPVRENKQVVANINIKIKPVHMLAEELKNYYTGKSSWNWILNPANGEILSVQYSENMEQKFKFKPDAVQTICNEINHNFEGKLEHTVQFDKKRKLLSAYFPLEIFDQKFGMVFSVDKDSLYRTIAFNTQMITFFFVITISIVVVLFQKIIKQLKIANTEREDSEKRWSFAVDGSGLGLWDWDLDKNKVFFSNQWKSMLGYEEDEIGNDLSEWENRIHPDDKEKVYEDLNKHLKGETDIYMNEHRVLCRDNSYKWVLDRGKIIEKGSHDRPIRAIGTHMDISDRKLNEKAIRKYQENLEGLVKERTKELEQVQKELITKALEAGRAQLSAMVLHNIGNAITPVNLNINRLKNSEFKEINQYLAQCYDDFKDHKQDLGNYVTRDERGKQVAAYMGELIASFETARNHQDETLLNIETGLEYISEILTLQQSYSGDKQEIKQKIDFNSLVQDSIKMQQSAIDKHHLTVTTDFADNIPRIKIEQNKLLQVVVNLIKNSCDAISQLNLSEHAGSDRTHDFINIRTCFSDTPSGQKIRLEITDSGIGVEKEVMDKIFDFGVSTKGSSGFGLYYCKTFVESNNGSLSIKSPGAGKGAVAIMEFTV